ncbi:MAG: aminotransferase class IV [Minisyncoccia bacterium]
MSRVYDHAYFGDRIVSTDAAMLPVTSSAILYGLSVYTVFPVSKTEGGFFAFRFDEHYKRLVDSSSIMGIDTFPGEWTKEKFLTAVKETIAANEVKEDVFARATVHVSALVPGTRSRDLPITLSIFLYEAKPIVPQNGAKVKTSVWRRVPDFSIPSRAKVNGAYVNSVLGRQDAIDSGYDDCVFLDQAGHVCELSAANIFIVRDGKLITPHTASDILEGINRRTILELARADGIQVHERSVDLTELYVADEVFACGTSSFIAPIIDVDRRIVGNGTMGPITKMFRERHDRLLHGKEPGFEGMLTEVG